MYGASKSENLCQFFVENANPTSLKNILLEMLLKVCNVNRRQLFHTRKPETQAINIITSGIPQ